MNNPNSIVLSGDLGGGKTTVSSQIAAALGIRRVSMGQLYRKLAHQQGLSAVQMNLRSERDEGIDEYIDEMQRQLADSGEPLVVDSRLAWHFFPQAFKVHLVADPNVAARRVMLRPQSDVEAYSTMEEAVDRLQVRSRSERVRFLKKYGVDKTRLRNYDLVCDTSDARPEDITKYIIRAFNAAQSQGAMRDESAPILILDPLRIYPTAQSITTSQPKPIRLPEDEQPWIEGAASPITAAYTGEYFYAVDGHRTLSAALHSGRTLIPAKLLADADEVVRFGLTAREYFHTEVDLRTLRDWQAAHHTQLEMPRHPMALQDADNLMPS